MLKVSAPRNIQTSSLVSIPLSTDRGNENLSDCRSPDCVKMFIHFVELSSSSALSMFRAAMTRTNCQSQEGGFGG